MKSLIKILKWIGIVALITLTSVLISTIAVENVFIQEVTETAKKAGGCSTVRIVDREKLGEELWKPIPERGSLVDEVYCVSPGTLLVLATDGPPGVGQEEYRTRGDIYYLYGLSSSKEYYSNHKCAPNVDYLGYHSDTYYYCGTHLTQDSTYTDRNGVYYDNLYDIGFIASWDQVGDPDKPGDWSAGKQQAFWMSQLSEVDYEESGKAGGGGYESGKALIKMADKYKTFYQNIMKKDEKGNTGMKPSTDVKTEDIKVAYDTEEELYKAGPFKVDYVDGKNVGEASEHWYSYGGISDMYLVEVDENEKVLRKIPIKHIIVRGKVYVVPENDSEKWKVFFSAYSPNLKKEGVNKIDYWAHAKAFLKPNEEFYVEYGKIEDLVGSLRLHIDFKWLVCEAEVCLRDGIYYMIDQHHYKLDIHCDGHRELVGYTSKGNPIYRRYKCGGCCHKCKKEPYVGIHSSQDSVYIVDYTRYLDEEPFEIPFEMPPDDDITFPITMKLGGYVYEDIAQTKETITNGIFDEGDMPLPNVEVAIFDAETNQLAELATLKQERPKVSQSEINNPADYTRRINPTLTDENGYYEFRGLSMEKKYYVRFTYNGQTYLPTDYLTSNGEFKFNSIQEMKDNYYQEIRGGGGNEEIVTSKYEWKYSSKGTELLQDRTDFDNRFKEIRSAPENYPSKNNLGITLSNGYNESFSIYDLMGFELQADGKYAQTKTQLIDGAYEINGEGQIVETTEIKTGRITEELKNYIKENRKYPQDIKEVYQRLNPDEEMWKMLQFIEDSKIYSYTKGQNVQSQSGYDLYPIYHEEAFTTYVKDGNRYPNNSYTNGTYDEDASTYVNFTLQTNGEKVDRMLEAPRDFPVSNSAQSKGAVKYKNVYPGQLQVNQGLWRRHITDLALKKDVFKVGLKVNGKTEVYNYNKREAEEQGYWEIAIRMQDYVNYYNTGYNRELYKDDYYYETAKTNMVGSDLEAYVTYKIIVRNQSQSILNTITELVDYYDDEYTYRDDLSWVMYKQNPDTESDEEIAVPKKSYYNMIHNETKATEAIAHAKAAQGSESSQYGKSTEYSLGSKYKNVYIKGLAQENKKLVTGESVYAFLTFKVNTQQDGIHSDRVILDKEEGSDKMNYVEINGYKTYYADGTQLPNGVTKSSRDVAGLIDIDSTPGNFKEEDLEGERYEKNFEDDTDRAKGLRFILYENAIRKVNGTVWDDERTYTSNNTKDAVIGDGIRTDGEETVNGVKVQLVEKFEDGKEYIWEETVSGSNKVRRYNFETNSVIEETNSAGAGNGKYEFTNYIPGNYFVRFIYGDGSETILPANNGGVSYNGQDFKSTIYQKEGDNGAVSNYTDPDYKIYDLDAYGKNLSDAKDLYRSQEVETRRYNSTSPNYERVIYQGREEVNNYSTNNVTNHKAEVLASPYKTPEYNGTKYSGSQMQSLYNELAQNTHMTSETGIIVIEFEYDRQDTDGYNDGVNINVDDKAFNSENNQNGKYTFNNIDLGLSERPKSQLEVSKKVSNVKITLANQSILFDANEAVENMGWIGNKEYNTITLKDEKQSNKIYNDYRNPEGMRKKVDQRLLENDPVKQGVIQPIMDEEIMHGANVQITYDMKVTNVGEVDYNEEDFYYTGSVSSTSNIVKTTANLMVDYIENNLQFRKNANNSTWNTVKAEELINNNHVNSNLNDIISKQYNVITTTTAFNKPLVPLVTSKSAVNETNQIKTTLVLSQQITPQNKTDDLTYNNLAELVEYSNTAGRRMAFSVVGNQNPKEDPHEIDSDTAESVVVLPPFGAKYTYIILGVAIAIILGAGIFIIKKKVIDR